jgi:hypothetical protein
MLVLALALLLLLLIHTSATEHQELKRLRSKSC